MTDFRNDPQAIDALVALAREAGRAVLDIYARAPAVRTKADASPVTDADEAAEAIIVAGLARLAPSVPIVAEEQVARSGAPATAPSRFWLVDPLDGTREFINRNGEFTINIALIEAGVPVAGIVYAPAVERLYGTAARGGAFREVETAARETIRVRQAPPAGLTVVASRSHNSPETQAFVATLPVASYCEAGSSLKFCTVAEGGADIYPRFGRTMEWDTAAGDAVLRAAGGSMRTANGQPFVYGKPGFENPPFIARGGIS